MARDRERACMFYICEGNCSKGRDGIFDGICQRCDLYQPKRGSLPRRENTKRQRLERAAEKDRYKDY